MHLALIFALATLCICIVTVTSHGLEADILCLAQTGRGATSVSLKVHSYGLLLIEFCNVKRNINI